MDKVLSARLDEAVVRRISYLAERLHRSKKAIIEEAVETYAARVDLEEKSDVFKQTAGAWRRKKSAKQTVDKARETFRRAMERRRR